MIIQVKLLPQNVLISSKCYAASNTGNLSTAITPLPHTLSFKWCVMSVIDDEAKRFAAAAPVVTSSLAK